MQFFAHTISTSHFRSINISCRYNRCRRFNKSSLKHFVRIYVLFHFPQRRDIAVYDNKYSGNMEKSMSSSLLSKIKLDYSSAVYLISEIDLWVQFFIVCENKGQKPLNFTFVSVVPEFKCTTSLIKYAAFFSIFIKIIVLEPLTIKQQILKSDISIHVAQYQLIYSRSVLL